MYLMYNMRAALPTTYTHLPPTLLQGAMAQCRLALKPDGLFLAAMFGGETLQVGGAAVQLRSVLAVLVVLMCE
jgi:hypothetical protein